MQCREFSIMADLSDKYYTVKSLANTLKVVDLECLHVFSIFMNVYEFSKFFTLDSICQYDNTSRAMHLHYIQFSW